MDAHSRNRGTWCVRAISLAQSLEDDFSGHMTAEERLEVMWSLTCDAWALLGDPIPAYRRDETPIKVLRRTGSGVSIGA